MLSDEELLAHLRELESDLVERKSSAKDTAKIAEAICAFSNDLPGHQRTGVVFVGINDDGTCANLPVTDELLRNLAGLRSDGQIQPLPLVAVEKRILDGCTVAVVTVEPSSNPPVRYNGRCWVRVGPRRAQASIAEEQRLVEKRRWGNLPFDQHGVRGATLDDIDLRRFKLEYLPSAVPPEVLAENNRSEAEQLVALRFSTPEGKPTNSAILVLGIDPRRWLSGAYIQFVRYDGPNVTDPIRDQKEVSGPIGDQLRIIDETLAANISTSADLSRGREVRQPDYPIAALQELIRNAVIHRTYEGSNAPTRVTWYSDRVEIVSPGGPFGQVNAENFGRPNITDYRNPALAEAAKNLGFAQRFGMGIARAQAELAKNGNPSAEFEVTATHVLAVVRQR